MYGYFANKRKYKLIVKNIYKNMIIYLKNRRKNGLKNDFVKWFEMI